MLYAHKFFKTEKAAQDFQKKHGGALYANVPSSRIREDYRVEACMAELSETERTARLDCWNWVWAYEVLSALPQSITLRNLEHAHIEDGLHHTAICDYAGPFIRLTTEE